MDGLAATRMPTLTSPADLAAAGTESPEHPFRHAMSALLKTMPNVRIAALMAKATWPCGRLRVSWRSRFPSLSLREGCSSFAIVTEMRPRHRFIRSVLANAPLFGHCEGSAEASGFRAHESHLPISERCDLSVGDGPVGSRAICAASRGRRPDSVAMVRTAEPLAPQPVSLSAPGTRAVEELLAFKDADVKFNLRTLMEILRDRRHEGWVLSAYPDPKTGRPLIGAGFSLDLPAREHPQPDPLNVHSFIEPSSAELWQAADWIQSGSRRCSISMTIDWPGGVKGDCARGSKRWSQKSPTRKRRSCSVFSAIQAIYNAKGYCRDFDGLSASQQMALSQLVYQMGVNSRNSAGFST